MRWSALAALLLLLSPQTTFAQAVVTNVGVDASQGFVLENGFVAFRVFEAAIGMDLNGDTDTGDFVLHIYDIGTGSLINTGFEASGQIHVVGDYVAWTVAEFLQGSDLNGDADLTDRVLHYAHMPTGAVTNVGLAANQAAVVGTTLGAPIVEISQNQDLNSDGDKGDAVLHLVDLSSGAITNVGVDAAAGFVIDGTRTVFATSEENESEDLNGDGDQNDFVLQAWDGSSVTSLGYASVTGGFQLDGDTLAFVVSESAQGSPSMPSGTSLNGDVDTDDFVVHLHDFATGTTNLGLAVGSASAFQLDDGIVAVAVSESAQGFFSLNDDGDTDDVVMHVHDGGTLTNLRLAITSFELDGGHLAFSVSEASQGQDLTGDAFQDDLVLHLYDTETGILENLLTDASLGFKLEGNMLLGFGADEANQGDGNGDGDTDDYTLFVFDISAGNLVDLAVDPSGGVETFLLDGHYVSFGVNEAAQGNSDFNGDGDTGDVVLHYFDAETTVSTNLGLDAKMGQQLSDGTIAFLVDEAAQGQLDLNGDGDAVDHVLHIAVLEPQVTSVHDRIEALIAQVRSLGLHPGIERSRIFVLRVAQRALERDRPCVAMKLLQSFQWSVEKRSGRGIHPPDADALVAETGEIIDLIEEENPDCASHRCRHGRYHR